LLPATFQLGFVEHGGNASTDPGWDFEPVRVIKLGVSDE
jgi:hypothetical protein